MEVLRTPDDRFADLAAAGYPFEPHYVDLPDGDVRMHYVDEGPGDGEVVLLLHGEPTWSYLYRHMIPVLVDAGLRAIAPDLIGFGRSDKPTPRTEYTYERHVGWMASFLEALDLTGITLFGQDWGGLVGLRLVAEHPDRFARVVAGNTFLPTGDGKPSEAFLSWQQYSQTTPELGIGRLLDRSCGGGLATEVVAAYDAPFPDESYKEGARQFPLLVPTSPDDPTAPANRAAWKVLEQFDKPFLTAFSDGDPITAGNERPLQSRIPGAAGQPHTTIVGAGHFLQEQKGPELAQVIVDFIAANPAMSWVDHRPGLAAESERLLARLPELLDEAAERAESIIGTSPLDARSLVRVARLAGLAAPDLVPVLRARDAETIVPVLAKLALRGGPTYVKLGQLVSSTRGLAPDWVADAFAGCRDAVPPAPRDAVADVLDRSGVLHHLRSWNPRPMASASVAQVHEGVLDDGTDVVLKVRRPGIVGVVSADAAYLLPILRLVQARNEKVKLANLYGTLDLMLRMFAQEADLRLEAASIVQMAQAFERASVDVAIPAPIPGLITKRVLVMERVDGVSAALDGVVSSYGHTPAELVRLAVAGVLETTMVDGIFHGDLHLGNVLVTAEGLALIDFGIVGRLSGQQRLALLALLQSALTEDRNGIIRALRDFGALPPDVDIDDFLSQLPPPLGREERERMMAGPGGREVMQERFSGIVRALGASGFRIPPELTLFAKNLVYLGDAIQRHAPELDLEAELGDTVVSILARVAGS